MTDEVKKHAPRLIELVALIVAMVLVQAFQPPRPCHCQRHGRQRQETAPAEMEELPGEPDPRATHGPP